MGRATAGPVFAADGNHVVVGVATIPKDDNPATTIVPLNVTAYTASTGEGIWQHARQSPPGRHMVAGEMGVSPSGDRVYVSATRFEPHPLDDDVPGSDSFPTASRVTCKTDVLGSPPARGFVPGWHAATACPRTVQTDPIVDGLEAETGQSLGRMSHQGPFQTRGDMLEVHPESGDVIVNGHAHRMGGADLFRTVHWPAEAWGESTAGPGRGP